MGIYFGENIKYNSMGKWISLLHRQSQMFLNNELKPYELNSSDIQYIIALYNNKKGLSQDELAYELIINKAAVARAIKSLEKKEMVIRYKNPENHRKNLVYLTPKGEALVNVLFEILDGWDSKLMETLDSDEYADMVDKLYKMSMSILNR